MKTANDKWTPTTTFILRHGQVPVLRVVAHPPGTHNKSVIVDHMTAVELVTAHGSRWFGFANAFIDSHLRMRCVGWNPRNELVQIWPDAENQA